VTTRDARIWIAVAGVTALGAALRVSGLRAFWNHPDEGIYYHIAHAPFEIASAIIANNAHPPLYYHLLRAVSELGDAFFWLRVPALLAGTLAIVALYCAGARLAGPVCGLVAAALLAVSPGAIALSQVARPYALVVLLSICALGALFRFVDSRRPSAAYTYAAWMAAAACVHYSAYLALSGTGVVLAVAGTTGRLTGREVRDLALAHVPLALLAAVQFVSHVQPAMLNSTMQAEALGQWLGEHFGSALGSNFVGLFDYLAGRAWAGVAAVLFVLSVGFAGWVALRAGQFRWVGGLRWSLALCLGALGVAGLASAASLYPFGATRHSFYLAPFLLLPVGAACAACAARGRTAVFAALGVLVLLAVAREPLANGLGLTDTQPSPDPEFWIPTQEIESLRAPLDALAAQPGLLIADLSTVYTLLPLMGAAGTQTPWLGGPGANGFAWNARRVVVVPHWQTSAEASGAGRPNHLWTQIRRLRETDSEWPALAGDVAVISADGRRLPREVRSLAQPGSQGGGLHAVVMRSAHVSAFALNVDAYQRALARAIRRNANQKRKLDAYERDGTD
jgi:hypothetical protein